MGGMKRLAAGGAPARALKAASAALLTAALITGCAPALTVGASSANDLQPAAYKTYSWESADQFPTGDPRLDNNTVFVKELQETVDAQLNKLGLVRTSGPADLTVHTHVTVRDRVNVYDVDRAAGFDQTRYGQTETVVYEEGTVMVDIAEVRGKKLVWRGWMQTDLSGVINNNRELVKRVREGMTKLFTKFPASCVATEE
jgi:hypothetical protein